MDWLQCHRIARRDDWRLGSGGGRSRGDEGRPAYDRGGRRPGKSVETNRSERERIRNCLILN